MKYLLTIALFLLISNLSSAQHVRVIELDQLTKIGAGNSYITFPTDLGNIEPLWFEGNVKPNFMIRQSKDARLMGVLTPQIILRMYQEESYPVRTPSYIPHISVYYQLNKKAAGTFTLMGKLGHHSNGQEGEYLLTDGSINRKTGNFATNYFEFGLYKTRYSRFFNAHQIIRSSFEVHPKGWIMEEMDDNYGRYRWKIAFNIFKLYDNETKPQDKAPFSVKSELIWMFGKLGQVENISLERLVAKLTLYYHPSFLEEIGFFVQLYHGRDYYNIYFDHNLNVVRFGIMTEKLSF
ncbi:hypothetical protein [Salinivirga cyanobacteriivorans]